MPTDTSKTTTRITAKAIKQRGDTITMRIEYADLGILPAEMTILSTMTLEGAGAIYMSAPKDPAPSTAFDGTFDIVSHDETMIDPENGAEVTYPVFDSITPVP